MIDRSSRRALDAVLGYAVAVLLAAIAQMARFLLGSPTAIPFISYMPFILMGGALGGLVPGLLTTALCAIEAVFFAMAPAGTFTGKKPDEWLGFAALVFTGIVSSILFDLLIRARKAALGAANTRMELARAIETRQVMLECMIQNSPAAMALIDAPDYTIRICNPAYQALAPGEPMTGRTIAQVWPEAAAPTLAFLERVRQTGTPSHAHAYRLNLHRGPGRPPEPRYFDFSFVPLPGLASDTSAPILAVLIEVTQHKHAQQSLERANSELRAIYENAPVMLLVVDEQMRVEKSNLLAGPVGRRPGDTLGCLHALESPEGCGHSLECAHCTLRNAIIRSIRDGILHTNLEGSLPVAVNGRRQDLSLLISTARMQSDHSTKALVCAQDITRLKTSQRQLEAALAEKTVLLQEIHHRVKNNLAIVSSLLDMKADTVENQDVRTALEQSRQRVHSMALIHELLYGNDRLDRVDFSEYARQLVGALESRHIRVELDLSPIELTIQRAVPCALILNELLTNAFKYAFPAGRPGTVTVRFHQSAPATLQLTVEDDGIGLTAPPSPKSLGLRIVHILTRQLDATLQLHPPPGTRFTLTLPA